MSIGVTAMLSERILFLTNIPALFAAMRREIKGRNLYVARYVRPAWTRRINMDNICDYDEGFTRREMYEETGRCLRCMVNPKCPYHIKAVKEEYGVNIGGRA